MDVSLPSDVAGVVTAAREMARRAGFGVPDQVMLATAASELATNIARYAGRGEVILRVVTNGVSDGFDVEAVDRGPGIADVEKAMGEGYSTAGSLGLGLPSVKRIMDEFAIESSPARGTRVKARKWARRSPR